MRNSQQPIHVSSVPSTLLSDHDVPHSSPEKSYPKSSSVLHMLKLGKTLKPDAVGKILEIYSFNIETMTWACIPHKVQFTIEDSVLGSGEFRKAYKATSSYPGYNHTSWVVKKYLDNVERKSQVILE